MKTLNVLIAGFCLFILGIIPGHAQKKQDKPNVLFFFVDDLRPNLGCYGDPYAVTPNIDKLAQTAVIFNRAYTQQAVCNPSRASLLTGLRPDENGVTDLVTHFRDKVPDVTTLPQIFKNNGYLAVGTGKVFHTRPTTIDPVSWSKPMNQFPDRGYLLPENQGKGKQNISEAADVPDSAYTDGKIANEAIRLLKEAKLAKAKGQPFFLGVGFKKPHAPYVAPKKYWDIYKDVNFKIVQPEKPVGTPELAFHQNQEVRGYRDVPDEGPIPAAKQQEIWHGYYACISYVDAQLGKVMKSLEELGLKENTIIVLWGDHGYHLGEQTSWAKSTNFELDTRVPLLISAPNMKGNGKKSDAIVETLDIYPTLIDLCNIQPESKLSGISLKPLLSKPHKKWNDIAFSQFFRPYKALTKKEPMTHMGYSVRDDRWRCTYWYDLNTNEVVEKELYHLTGNNINIEDENLAGKPEYAKTESRLADLIDQYKNGKYNK